MPISGANNQTAPTLNNFIYSLGYGHPDKIKIESVADQNRILGYLVSLFSNESASQHLIDQEVFVWPEVEQFFIRFFTSLDQSLESKAKEVFQHGWCYITRFIGSHNAQHVVRRLLIKLGEHFPRLQETYDRQLTDTVAEFFRPSIGEFFNAYSIDKFSMEFPCVYELFIKPLTNSGIHRNKKLFNFYCNPWIYNPILEIITNADYLHCWSGTHIRWLEDCLHAIKVYASNESWQELANKSVGLLDASDGLEAFADRCSSLLGEIKTACYLAKHQCLPGDKLIFLEDDNLKGKKDKKKNCDLMIVREEGSERILIEVKTKSPRHGVNDPDSGVWDNFFSNFCDSISSYLTYIDGRISPLFGLTLKQSYPLLSAYEGSSYGKVLPFIYETVTRSPYTNKTPVNKWKSEKKIEVLLRALFMKPLILHTACVPLTDDNVRFLERRQLTEEVISKDWVCNTMQAGVIQLQEACSRQLEEGQRISKVYFALDLSLSYRLLQDPYSYHDGNMKELAVIKLQEVFQRFRDHLSVQGFDIELILP